MPVEMQKVRISNKAAKPGMGIHALVVFIER
jgi:hypothetical protein